MLIAVLDINKVNVSPVRPEGSPLGLLTQGIANRLNILPKFGSVPLVSTFSI